MLNRLLTSAAVLLTGCAIAWAANTWPGPDGDRFGGQVQMCLNASGVAVPVSNGDCAAAGAPASEATQADILAALNTLIAQAVPSCTAAPVVSGSAGDSLVLKASAGTLCGVYVTNATATPGFLMVFNSTTEPADGAVTPFACVPVPANGIGSVSFGTGFGSSYSTGITASISSTGCFTKTTTGMSGFFAGQVL